MVIDLIHEIASQADVVRLLALVQRMDASIAMNHLSKHSPMGVENLPRYAFEVLADDRVPLLTHICPLNERARYPLNFREALKHCPPARILYHAGLKRVPRGTSDPVHECLS